ncbi:MAG: OmpA family protein [Nannocystaceae bacterium]|nr:OmpA family protein [Deltaproteobacteria bacterium]MBP7291750.1 OmpA family protein [Nannocystaceae bacterium]
MLTTRVVVLLLSLTACAHEAPASRNVHFATAKVEPVSQDDFVTLGRVVEIMDHDDKLRLLVVGHTDSVGTDEANRVLAFQRATRVRTLLLAVEPDLVHRSSIAYYGKSRPIADNATAEGKAKNRRVELYFYVPENGVENDVKLQREFGGGLEFEASASATASIE